MNVDAQEQLDEYWLSYFPIIHEMFSRSNMMYRALKVSAGAEYNHMIKVHHSRAVSRIGFVSQDIMDLEDAVLADIRNRGVEIGDTNAECLQAAERLLANATESAGDVIVLVSRDWSEELYLINDDFIEPLLKEVELLTSLFDIEMLVTMVRFNVVTEIEGIVTQMYLEAVLYDMLFEYFVADFLSDFIIFDQLTNGKNGRIFRTLDEALVTFTASATAIRNSLVDCN